MIVQPPLPCHAPDYDFSCNASTNPYKSRDAAWDLLQFNERVWINWQIADLWEDYEGFYTESYMRTNS